MNGASEMIVRFGRVIQTLLGAHVDMARHEAARDAGRVAVGAFLMASALFVVGATLVLLDAAAVIALHTYTVLDWPVACLVVAGGNLLVAGTLVLAGKARLQQPVMQETRGLVKKTVAALRET
jgi:cytochrome c biogenesis protein CcdA